MDEQTKELHREAERLKLLDRQTQRDLVAMHRILARNPKLPKKDRQQARQRADALARLLGLSKRPNRSQLGQRPAVSSPVYDFISQ
jgi:hypothetical protein